MKTSEEKFETVINKNTFYFINSRFENDYEGYIYSLKQAIVVLKNDILTNGLKKDIFIDLLQKKQNGLKILLAITGFSNESLKRLITIIRITDDKELNELVYKDKWCSIDDRQEICEWGDKKIESLIKENPFFCHAIVNIFFEGASIPFLSETLPLFELKKLDSAKLNFELEAMIDTIVRYKEKGSYSGKPGNNAESQIIKILEESGIQYEKGDLSELTQKAINTKRTLDFIIPNKTNPIIIIECSYLTTTGSGQGDKSKVEISVNELLKTHYPKAKFIGFVDGIGWYVRKADLKRMVEAYEDVFTFHKEELDRFKLLLENNKTKFRVK